MDLAMEMEIEKPVVHTEKCSKDAARKLAGFISQHGIKRLKVAGQGHPGILRYMAFCNGY